MMSRRTASSVAKLALACSCLWLVGSGVTGCAWFGATSKPDWVDGRSSEYPAERYLIGVGQAESRTGASDQAYAAVAKIFHAQVEAQAKDWESYVLVERRDASQAERRLTIDNLTKVSTDKVLENVSIADAWYDVTKRLYYALAVMNRAQAETALMEKMAVLDRSIAADVTEARATQGVLEKVQALRRSLKNVVVRETYNADLRVIRLSGQGTTSSYQVSELSGELERFLATNLGIEVQVSGVHAESIQHALVDGLIREGFQVSTSLDNKEADQFGLSVRGAVRLFPIELQDPHFKYVRWCSYVEVLESAQQRVVGVVTRGGKEGHVTHSEAMAKAMRVMQQTFSSEVAHAIAAHIFGETVLPVTPTVSAGCPREESLGKP